MEIGVKWTTQLEVVGGLTELLLQSLDVALALQQARVAPRVYSLPHEAYEAYKSQ